MTDIIDFIEEKDKRDFDPEYVLVMPDGSRWYKFFAEYDFKCDAGGGVDEALLQAADNNGAVFLNDVYHIEFWAQNKEEAIARVEAMRSGLEYRGQLFSSVEAY